MTLHKKPLLLSLSTTFLILLPLAHTSQPTAECPLLGPSFPASFNISNTAAFQDAVTSFAPALNNLFDAGTLNRTGTSFAIDVFSAETNASIFSYAHSGEALNAARTAGVIDDDTIFRIGSVSKLYTVYAILANAGSLDVFDELVVKYVPELVQHGEVGENTIEWNEVTIGALAAQMGGTGGFTLDNTLCGEVLNNTCSVESFLAEMRDKQKARVPVFETSLYSDAGFGVLGRVLERMTNQTYNDALRAVLVKNLGLSSSTTVEPKGDGLNALNLDIVLDGGSSWGLDNQVIAPSGGVYSNAHDLRLLGLSILNSHLLSPVQTRQWLKPRSHTSSLTGALGAPWEIYRLQIPVSPTSNLTRISDVYTKAGGQQAYGTIFGLSPDHKIGWSILVGGPKSTSDRWVLQELIGGMFVRAAEAAAWEVAAATYPGTFVDPGDQSTNITITVDADQPGLGLQSFYFQGQDARGALLDWQFIAAPLPAGINVTTRMYPPGARFADAQGVQTLVFNAVAQVNVQPRAPAGLSTALFDVECATWSTVGYLNTTDFEIGLENDGAKAQSVRWGFGNVTMVRSE